MQYNMFTTEGGEAVAAIVAQAHQFADVYEGSVELIWNWCLNELAALARNPKFEEAEDTAARQAVYDAII